jgi:DNA-binding HxlR family transcriptional regulator
MRSYDQYCALARALDIVGDRWTLLIIRELLLRPCRYGELQDGLSQRLARDSVGLNVRRLRPEPA